MLTVACLRLPECRLRWEIVFRKRMKDFPLTVVCCLLETNLNLFALDNFSVAIRSLRWLPVSVTTQSLWSLLHLSLLILNIISKLSEPHQQSQLPPSSLKSSKIWGYEAMKYCGGSALALEIITWHDASWIISSLASILYTDIVGYFMIHWDRCNTDSVSHILWLSAPLPSS